MTTVDSGRATGPALRTAAISGAAFTICYVVHRILQGSGPDGTTAAAVAAYNVEHRAALLLSEVAVGIALLAVIPFVAALVPVIWRAGQETLAVATAVSGATFLAMGFLSLAAETALVGVAGDDEPGAAVALHQLQGRTPVVWTITALVTTVSLAIVRTRLIPRWVGAAGLVAAAFFLLGSVFSVVGSAPEGNASLFGVGLFIAWMLLLSGALWRSAGRNLT